MKPLFVLSLILLAAVACAEDDPLYPVRIIRAEPAAPHISVVRGEDPPVVTPPPHECEVDCSPGEGEGEGEGEGDGYIQLLLTVRNPPGDQDVVPGDIKVGLFGFDAENLTEYEIGPLYFVGRLLAWFDPADPDGTQVDPSTLVENCELWLVTEAGWSTMDGPVILAETGDIDMSSNGIDIFEHGGGRLELHCDIAASVPSADVYLQLQHLDIDGPFRRYVDTTNAPPVIRIRP